MEKLLAIEERKLKLLETEEDENFLFFKSLLPYMRQLSPLRQLKIRTNVSSLIMNEFERNSYGSNTSNSFSPSTPEAPCVAILENVTFPSQDENATF